MKLKLYGQTFIPTRQKVELNLNTCFNLQVSIFEGKIKLFYVPPGVWNRCSGITSIFWCVGIKITAFATSKVPNSSWYCNFMLTTLSQPYFTLARNGNYFSISGKGSIYFMWFFIFFPHLNKCPANRIRSASSIHFLVCYH